MEEIKCDGQSLVLFRFRSEFFLLYFFSEYLGNHQNCCSTINPTVDILLFTEQNKYIKKYKDYILLSMQLYLNITVDQS